MRSRVAGPLSFPSDSLPTVVQARLSANQSIANSASTTVVFNVKDTDLNSEFDTSTGVFTAKFRGVYLVSASGYFASATWSGSSYCYISLYKNGANFVSYFDVYTLSLTHLRAMSLECSVLLKPGDTLSIQVVQNTGSALAFVAHAYHTYFHISRAS